jgi:hypothetical protein
VRALPWRTWPIAHPPLGREECTIKTRDQTF